MLDYVLSKVANGHSTKPNGHTATNKRSSRLLSVNGYSMTSKSKKTEVDDIDLLVSLISSSAAEIKSQYRSTGITPPSLDDSATTGIELMHYTSKQTIAKSTRILEAAFAQLRASLSRPEHVLLDVLQLSSPLCYVTHVLTYI